LVNGDQSGQIVASRLKDDGAVAIGDLVQQSGQRTFSLIGLDAFDGVHLYAGLNTYFR
jgi:hypothetical protein